MSSLGRAVEECHLFAGLLSFKELVESLITCLGLLLSCSQSYLCQGVMLNTTYFD